MIEMDAALLKQLAGEARGANEAIGEAAALLNQIELHDNWGCIERYQINDFTIHNKNKVRRLQDAGRSFYAAIDAAGGNFEELERQFPSMFHSVDGLLGTVLVIPVRTSVSAPGKTVQMVGKVIGQTVSWGSGSWTNIVRALTSAIRITDFSSLRSQDTFCDGTHSIKVKGNPEDCMSQAERTKVVVDDTTIYEIDLECQECKNRKECEKNDEREVILCSKRPR